MRCHFDKTSDTKRSTSGACIRSTFAPVRFPTCSPALLSSAAHSFSDWYVTTTRAPDRSRSKATELPSAPVPPVTIATRCSNSITPPWYGVGGGRYVVCGMSYVADREKYPSTDYIWVNG